MFPFFMVRTILEAIRLRQCPLGNSFFLGPTISCCPATGGLAGSRTPAMPCGTGHRVSSPVFLVLVILWAEQASARPVCFRNDPDFLIEPGLIHGEDPEPVFYSEE